MSEDDPDKAPVPKRHRALPLPSPGEPLGPDLLDGRDPDELSDEELIRLWDLYIAEPDLHPTYKAFMMLFREANWLPKLIRERKDAEKRIDAYRRTLRAIPGNQKNLKAGDISEINKSRKEAQRAVVESNSDKLPDRLQEEMQAVRERSDQLFGSADVVETLGHDELNLQVRIAATHELASRLENLAKNLGMYAIEAGTLNQAQVSRLLEVAPMTVNRWVKAAREHQEQEE